VADQEARADAVGEMLIRPQGDVVAEPRRLLVRVRMAAQPGQQRDVVDDRSLGLLELEVLGDTEPEYAGTQHVLHRLAEPQVRGQRDRGDQLRQPHVRSGERRHGYLALRARAISVQLPDPWPRWS
jgi:hypothetical protein